MDFKTFEVDSVCLVTVEGLTYLCQPKSDALLNALLVGSDRDDQLKQKILKWITLANLCGLPVIGVSADSGRTTTPLSGELRRYLSYQIADMVQAQVQAQALLENRVFMGKF